jgi:hypothetical protein
MPKYYGSKSSFGDADILVLNSDNINIREYIEATFKPNEIFHNGDCWSFDYKELQIDLIVCSVEFYDTSLTYFAYNDLGNYIGRLAHRFGLKYGQEGLWYDHYFKGQNIGKIYVSSDYSKIFEFLGLDYNRFLQGFWTLEEIFFYIAESPYFNWKMFQLGSLNKINRDRNAKRASYMSFLEWIDKNVANEEHECLIAVDKSIYLKSIMEAFPNANIDSNIKRLEYEKCKELYIKSKFSGKHIIEAYGFDGKTLGKMMNGFKENLGPSYDNIIINLDFESILNIFDSYVTTVYNEMNNK